MKNRNRGRDYQRPGLFAAGTFTAHSGGLLSWKLECDALNADDLETLAAIAARGLPAFGSVYGVPRGGIRFATILMQYSNKPQANFPLLIVDDVLTTGNSMNAALQEHSWPGRAMHPIGLVIFARAKPAWWIHAVFTLNEKFGP